MGPKNPNELIAVDATVTKELPWKTMVAWLALRKR